MEVKQRTAEMLVEKLASKPLDLQKQAVCELRLLAKYDMDNRLCIAQAGAIPILVDLLDSSDAKIQENAVTTLLNLSIYPKNRGLIMTSPNFLDKVFAVVKTGKLMEARENSAALLFSLLVVEDYRPIIGQRPGAIIALLDLVRQGSARCKKDALKTLFHLSLCPENRAKVVAAGAIPMLVSLLLQGKAGLVEDGLAVLAQVGKCVESVTALRSVSAIPILVDLVETGSSRAQENAVSALLSICQCGGEDVIEDVLDIHTCLSSIAKLLTSGSSRAKSKASTLMQLLVVNDSDSVMGYLSSTSISTR